VTAPTGPGGMVSGRDFILLRRMKIMDGKNVVAYSSSDLAEIPPVKNFVRLQIFIIVFQISLNYHLCTYNCPTFVTALRMSVQS
jgi:hypothetical protein